MKQQHTRKWLCPNGADDQCGFGPCYLSFGKMGTNGQGKPTGLIPITGNCPAFPTQLQRAAWEPREDGKAKPSPKGKSKAKKTPKKAPKKGAKKGKGKSKKTSPKGKIVGATEISYPMNPEKPSFQSPPKRAPKAKAVHDPAKPGKRATTDLFREARQAILVEDGEDEMDALAILRMAHEESA